MENQPITPVNIFIGETGTGKSSLAVKLASKYSLEEITFIPAAKMKEGYQYLFSACTPKTRLLIVDDIPTPTDLYRWVRLTYRYVTVEPRGKKTFIISPEVILICKENITREQLDALDPVIYQRCIIYEVEVIYTNT